jgi:PAS domain-containing protein
MGPEPGSQLSKHAHHPMRLQDLEAFDSVPFLLWAKDENGKHLFGNKAICDLAGENVVGKRDNDLIWANDAESLQAHDRKVLESGKTEYLHEYVQKSRHGQATLNVCKWAGELDGRKCCFGISFVINND